MDISWLGRWAVRIQSGQTAVVADPYYAEAGWAMPDTSADIVTISMDAPRHSNSNAVGGSPRVLRGPGEYEIANFYISGMGTPAPSPFPDEQGDDSDRQVNTVYTMRAEGVRVCHAGAVVPPLTSRQFDELNNVEVLVVDAGGDEAAAKRVARLVNQIGPRIVVPVGWQVVDVEGGSHGGTAALESLLGELGVTEAASQPSLRVTRTNLPREMRVVALRPAR
jgi:L-ascorbate metabolism protein UlaG (beta-lactamase superfamily)